MDSFGGMKERFTRDKERAEWERTQFQMVAVEQMPSFELAAIVKYDLMWMLTNYGKEI